MAFNFPVETGLGGTSRADLAALREYVSTENQGLLPQLRVFSLNCAQRRTWENEDMQLFVN